MPRSVHVWLRSLALCLMFTTLAACDGELDSADDGSGGGSGGTVSASNLELTLQGSGLYTEPAISRVTLMFRAQTKDEDPVAGLTLDKLLICEGPAGGTLQPLATNNEAQAVLASRSALPYTLKTVLVLDISSSVVTQLDKMKAAARQLVARIEPGQEIAIYAFDSKVTMVNDFTSDVTVLNAAIDSLPTDGDGSTNLYAAAITAYGRWTPQYATDSVVNGYAIFVTDGYHNTDSSPISNVTDARSGRLGFVIGVGDTPRLTELATISGNSNRVVRLSNYDQLNTALQSVIDEMQDFANSFYNLHYTSTRRDTGTGSNYYELKVLPAAPGVKCETNGGIGGSYSSVGFQ
jgi:hypothetical protein